MVMDHFNYSNGRLLAEGVDVESIAAAAGTPLYVYSKATFLDHFRGLERAYRAVDPLVCFSVKACSNVHILAFLAESGSGFDIVSGGELYRALQAGADPGRIVYAGVGKTDAEIAEALKARIGYFNVESEQELENLIRLAKQASPGGAPKAALRVNPDVDPGTHAYTATGLAGTKFGVSIADAAGIFSRYGRETSIKLCAIHVHLGSAGKTVQPYSEAIEKVLVLVERLRGDGFGIDALNIGGGYGADYVTGTAPAPADYASAIVPLVKDKGLGLILEPGASIAANAAVLVAKVLYRKESGGRKFVIVDAAMNDLIRPPLYDAFHFIWPARPAGGLVPRRRDRVAGVDGTEIVDVVGPVCESADFIGRDRAMPPVRRGDLLAVFSAGAYGFTMSSNYNARRRAAEVLVDGDSFSVIRRRETYEDLVAPERL
jgi:diaminopimelate decarboxylase